MGGGLESRCVGRVYGADSAVRLVRFATQGSLFCNKALEMLYLLNNDYSGLIVSFFLINKLTLVH